MFYRRVGKRFIDVLIAIFAILLIFPIMLLIAIFVRFFIGKPILFKQKRPGLNNTPFTLYKIRTMTNSRDKEGVLLPDAKRLTKFGNFLRSTSLDEVPELWNVLKGDMSLVGPRPLLVEYLEHYSPKQMRRHDVRPGITGWAQINGRNLLSWEEKFDLDIWYVENMSFLLDIKIIINTISVTLRQSGINSKNHVTMSKFLGTKGIDDGQ